MEQERISITQLAELFEIPMSQIPIIIPTGDETTLKKNVDLFKKIFKKQYRILVKKYHPDIAEDKTKAHEKLILLNKYMQAINTMRVAVRPPPVSFTFRFYSSYSSYGGGTTTTSTTNWS